MISTAVIQVKQGIGDVIWHLPFIKAIAAASPGGQVTFLTLPSSRGKELLQAEPCVAKTLYFEHQGNEIKRGLHLVRLVTLLRRERPRTIWILDRTTRPALAAALARIPERIGVGFGAQRFLITNAGIGRSHFHDWPTELLRELLRTMAIPLPTTEPELRLPEGLAETIGARYGALPRPWIALALGGSHPAKDWPLTHWDEFSRSLRQRTKGTIFIIGGPDFSRNAETLIAAAFAGNAVNACGLSIIEAAALLRNANLFVGPDSGPLNVAAAVGTRSFGLYGATTVHAHSRFIEAIEPADRRLALDGMQRIAPAQVLERIEPYLAVT